MKVGKSEDVLSTRRDNQGCFISAFPCAVWKTSMVTLPLPALPFSSLNIFSNATFLYSYSGYKICSFPHKDERDVYCTHSKEFLFEDVAKYTLSNMKKAVATIRGGYVKSARILKNTPRFIIY